MVRRGLRVGNIGCLVIVSLLSWHAATWAVPLDKDGDIKLGMRTYVTARVGTEDTHDGVPLKSATGVSPAFTTSDSATFPHSDAGHLRQNRMFLEAKLNHNLDRLVREGVGPLSLLNDLPFKVKGLGYLLEFRGEGEGLYDWGPNEYSTAVEFEKNRLAHPTAAANQILVDTAHSRAKLRRRGTDRERLFEAYLEGNFGNLFVRAGRQLLSWGETDGFQLLDHINPLDSSFGGFLISLDERRVPLDMLRSDYFFGDYGPLSEIHAEGFAAIDNKVGYYPGTPAGSAWTLPSLGPSSNATKSFALQPARTIGNTRGGIQVKFNALNATFGLAHYYTFFDTPAVQVFTNGGSVAVSFNDHLPCPVNPRKPQLGDSVDPAKQNCGYPTHAVLSAPRVQVSGASTTFALEQYYAVIRSEVAYFKDEPAFTQGQLDPFIFNTTNHPNTGYRRLRDSINAVAGLDKNQWIRSLNANQTFFISTQFFYKHIAHSAGNGNFRPDGTPNPNREVLPIDLNVLNFGVRTVGARVEPLFIRQPSSQYLQTLFITTSYRSGTISPFFLMFYDWGGAFLYLPGITFSRDPWRFGVSYSWLDSHIYKGGSGVSLLKDRDNVLFQLEYVI